MILTQTALSEQRKKLGTLKKQLSNIQNASKPIREEWLSSIQPEDIKVEAERLKEEIHKIEKLLSQAENVTNAKENQPEGVKVKEGARIKLRVDYGEGDVEEIDAMFVETVTKIGDVSPVSPIGKAIYGKTIGEKTQAKLPGGETAKIEILGIEI